MMNFENLEYSDGKDVVIDYLIPTKTVEIKITFLGKYYSHAKEKDIEITQEKIFYIQRKQECDHFHNFKLEIESGNYILRVFGKNGESIPDIELDFFFSSGETSATSSKV